MSDMEKQRRDWKFFFFPAIIILAGYVIFGKIENLLNISTNTYPFDPSTLFGFTGYLQYYVFTFLMFLVFGLGFIFYYRLLTKDQETSKKATFLYVGILTLVFSFIIFIISEEYLGLYANGWGINLPAIYIPNVFQWFVSFEWYSAYITINWYHIFIFFLFFPSICYGFIIMDYLHFRDKKRSLRLIFMFLGVNILGLMWQDFYYFVSHPTYYLIPGCRYGVYFTQWLGPIPIIYVVANALGLGIMWMAVSVKSDIKYWEIYKYLIFIGILLTIGIIIHTVKIPFIPNRILIESIK